MRAPLKTMMENIPFRDWCKRSFSNFIIISNSNCKRSWLKMARIWRLSCLEGSNLSYFLRRSQTIILIPSFNLLLHNFNQIMRKWESFLALFPFLEIEILRPNPTFGVSLTNIGALVALAEFSKRWPFLPIQLLRTLKRAISSCSPWCLVVTTEWPPERTDVYGVNLLVPRCVMGCFRPSSISQMVVVGVNLAMRKGRERVLRRN